MTVSKPKSKPVDLDDEQLLRYNRQIMLPQIDIEGQQRLLNARVLIVGMGGLGSPIAMYLAASGVGELVVVDPDRVELSNLQRQIIHTSVSLGQEKVDSAQRTLHALNPDVSIIGYKTKLDQQELIKQTASVHAVVDATDNFASRFALNRACYETRTPLVSGAVIRMEGQVAVFRLDQPNRPCYQCLYGNMEEPPETCSTNGILGSVAGIIGCIQATETIKVLLDMGETLSGRLLLLDAYTMDFRVIRLVQDPNCAVCGPD